MIRTKTYQILLLALIAAIVFISCEAKTVDTSTADTETLITKTATNESGGLLKKSTTIKIGTNEISFRGGSYIDFHGEGAVFSGHPTHTTTLTVGGIPFRFKKEEVLAFYSNGAVLGGTLETNTKIIYGDYGIVFQAGSEIYFYESGGIKAGTTTQGGFSLIKNGEIKALQSGYVEFAPDKTLIR